MLSNAFPSALVPLEATVMVLPSFEITVRLVELYAPPAFLAVLVKVFASTCVMATVSHGAPVTGYSFPSYLAV